MNHAYVDASWQEQPGHALGAGGWGLVLLRPGYLPQRIQGHLDAYDNNAAELRAVLEAVRSAPAGEALTVHTDNQAVIATVARGRGPVLLTELSREVQLEAETRRIHLHARYAPRTGRHMQSAHELANEARKGGGAGQLPTQTEVLIEHRQAAPEARVSLRRVGAAGHAERLTAHITFDPQSDVPPSVQVLLAALQLAQPGEQLVVRRASRIAQALWHRPERALRPAVQSQLLAARLCTQQQGVLIEFVGAC